MLVTPLLLKAKTWFLKWKVKLVVGLLAFVTLFALLAGSYQLGKRDAQAHCEQQKLAISLQQERQTNEFLLNLQEENLKFYRDQSTFNNILANEINKKEKEIVYKVDTLVKEIPVEVSDPCGNASIGYGYIELRNAAGSAAADSN